MSYEAIAKQTADLALSEIRDAYLIERDYRTSANPQREDANACRYCGEYRIVYPGTMLDGHALCMVSKAFQQMMAQRIDESRLSFVQVSAATGMTVAVVRRWYRAGKGWPSR